MPYFKYQSKNIFYTETGHGSPLVFLHGNTASSKMFEPLLPLYQEHFKVVLIDFIGNGQSDRIDKFPVELWFDEALQTMALIEHLNYGKVNLVGTSGGAWVAINVALERPDLVNKAVADSFDGRTLHDGFFVNLQNERADAKNDIQARQFYEWCQGKDWEKVVDLDTEALLQFSRENAPVFHKLLRTLKTPVLFMGSQADTMVRANLLEEYEKIKNTVVRGEIHMFKYGFHPAIVSNAEMAAQVIRNFFDG